jgi:hypothetical protein
VIEPITQEAAAQYRAKSKPRKKTNDGEQFASQGMRIELSKLLAPDSPVPSDSSSEDFISARVTTQSSDNAYCNRAANDPHAGEYLALENAQCQKMVRPPGRLEVPNAQRPPGEWRHHEENEWQCQQQSSQMMGGTWPMVGGPNGAYSNGEQMMWFIHPFYAMSL